MTIAELMISLGIFSLVATTSAGLFVQIIKTSRLVNERSAAIDTLSLVVEQIAREIRTGKDFSSSVSSDQRVNDSLTFINYMDERVIYSFTTDSNGIGKITKTIEKGVVINGPTPITPSSVNVEGVFIVTDFSADRNKEATPRVLVSATAKNSKGQILARAQTTVGARLIYYKP